MAPLKVVKRKWMDEGGRGGNVLTDRHEAGACNT